MKSSNIVLAGFMASGKTTVGGLLSKMTGKQLLESDAIIEERAGMRIEEIFSEKGEAYFRLLERKVVDDLAEREGCVIALGGGAVLDQANVEALRKNGVIYILGVTPVEVLGRVGGDGGRPLLGEGRADVERLMAERSDAYRRAADVVVDTTGREPEEVAREIAADFAARLKDPGGRA